MATQQNPLNRYLVPFLVILALGWLLFELGLISLA